MSAIQAISTMEFTFCCGLPDDDAEARTQIEIEL